MNSFLVVLIDNIPSARSAPSATVFTKPLLWRINLKYFYKIGGGGRRWWRLFVLPFNLFENITSATSAPSATVFIKVLLWRINLRYLFKMGGGRGRLVLIPFKWSGGRGRLVLIPFKWGGGHGGWFLFLLNDIIIIFVKVIIIYYLFY